MGFWRGRGKEPPEKPAPVQLRPADRHPFSLIDGYVPLHQPEFSLYRAIREAVPVVDAAVLKLVRLAGGVGVTCQDKEAERALNHFLRTVPVGWNQKGIQAFLDSYLDCLLTCGRAVGEIVPSRDGRDIAAVLCGRVSDVQVKEGDSPLEVLLALRRPDGRTEVLPRQELLLFTPYHPSPEHPYGVSLLHSLPFLSGVRSEAGEPGCYLKGYAYMLRTQENEGLIAEIAGGIKKEVSVSCAVSRCVCSICGHDIHDRGLCSHVKGRTYEGKRCIARLADPTDAFEWSFVAVPAQPRAGAVSYTHLTLPTIA